MQSSGNHGYQRRGRSTSALLDRGDDQDRVEYAPLAALFDLALRDVADRRLPLTVRAAAARAVAFGVREQFVTEAIATDILTAARKSLDVPKVVGTLLRGLRDALGDHERVTTWTRDLADRAVRGNHFASFISALRVLVDLRDFDGAVPARWRLALLRCVEIPELAPRVFLFARAYTRRFPAECWWTRTVRAQSMIACLRRGVSVAEMREARESCAVP